MTDKTADMKGQNMNKRKRKNECILWIILFSCMHGFVSLFVAGPDLYASIQLAMTATIGVFIVAILVDEEKENSDE